MEYIVKVGFDDLRDNNYRYEPGDKYPREGYMPDEARINELSTEANRRNTVLISAVKTGKSTKPKDEAKEATKEESAKKDTKKTSK